MKLTTERMVKQSVEHEVPDYFSNDDTPRGLAVDAYLRSQRYRERSGELMVRSDLYESSHEVVEAAIRNLTEAYAIVDTITAVVAPTPTDGDHGVCLRMANALTLAQSWARSAPTLKRGTEPARQREQTIEDLGEASDLLVRLARRNTLDANPALHAALLEIASLDDPDLPQFALEQHDRQSGAQFAYRQCAQIAAKAGVSVSA